MCGDLFLYYFITIQITWTCKIKHLPWKAWYVDDGYASYVRSSNLYLFSTFTHPFHHLYTAMPTPCSPTAPLTDNPVTTTPGHLAGRSKHYPRVTSRPVLLWCGLMATESTVTKIDVRVAPKMCKLTSVSRFNDHDTCWVARFWWRVV